MKWFKHMVNTVNDEKIADLIDRCGIEGYGYYWRVLEVIADQMDKTDKCEVVYSMSQWGRLLYSHPNKVRHVVDVMGDIGLIRSTRDGDKLRVTSPNLLKYRDEYSKKSGHSPDKLRTNSGLRTEAETDTEVQTETDTEKKTEVVTPTPKPKAKKQVLSDDEWLDKLRNDPTYSHVDIDTEYGKAQNWCEERRRQCTRRFFINWLNRIEKPMNASGLKKQEVYAGYDPDTDPNYYGGTEAELRHMFGVDSYLGESERKAGKV